MLNYWWVTRPKRKLNTVPEILSCCAGVSLNSEWQGNIYTHLEFEQALEGLGLKRVGERRDQGGSGGRTYYVLLFSLGLIFIHEATGQTKLTLAGEAIINGESPVEILKGQILKFQFPSPFSLSPNSRSRVNDRFRLRPFRFVLRLLRDERLDYAITENEIAKIVATEAERETDSCYNHIVQRIIQYRNSGDAALCDDFISKYAPSTGKVNPLHPYSHLTDLANTIVNWLDYTQLIVRSEETKGEISILPEKIAEVDSILADGTGLIDRANEQEFFQRKYGLPPWQSKDNRNLALTRPVGVKMIEEQRVRQAFISYALRTPILRITSDLIEGISHATGVDRRRVEDTLMTHYPQGAVSAFMTEYFEMAFRGRDNATDFEKATAELFKNAFHFDARHVGPIGLTPDVLIISDEDGYQAIIDNKAYSKYSISNDHHNRMVHNYINNLNTYSGSSSELAFFSYIAGGFCSNIDSQLNRIVTEASIKGSAVSVSHMIKMVEKNISEPYSHSKIRDIFSVSRLVSLRDF